MQFKGTCRIIPSATYYFAFNDLLPKEYDPTQKAFIAEL